MRSPRGYTLTEVLIVIAIVAIIAAFAFPNYTQQLQRSRRTDAMEALLEIAGEQEKFYLRNNAYTDSLADLGFTKARSSAGFYALSLTQSADGFTVTATTDGPPQAADLTCARFAYDEQGRKQAFSSTDDDTTARCWQ
jgi:type IV pilus assembly protein PilE